MVQDNSLDKIETLEGAKTYIRLLYTQLQEQKEYAKSMQETLNEIRTELKRVREMEKAEEERKARLMENLVSLTRELNDANMKVLELTRKLEIKGKSKKR